MSQPVYAQQVVTQEVIAEAAPPVVESQVDSQTPPDQTTTPEGLYFQRFAEESFLASGETGIYNAAVAALLAPGPDDGEPDPENPALLLERGLYAAGAGRPDAAPARMLSAKPR